MSDISLDAVLGIFRFGMDKDMYKRLEKAMSIWHKEEIAKACKQARKKLFEQIRSEAPTYNSKISRSYFQANSNPMRAHKNGYRLGVRETLEALTRLEGNDE